MGSTRLPGKVMKPLCGKPMLWHIITRLGYSKMLEKIIIATTDKEEDKVIVKFAEKMGIDYYCGSSEDVLDRYYQAAKQFNISQITRITADCPLIDPEVVDKIADYYLMQDYDYVSNAITPTFPDGLDTEIFSFKALEKMWSEARLPSEREHVTAYIVNHPELFRLFNVSKDGDDLSMMRWTVDTKADFEFIAKVFDELFVSDKIFYMRDVINLLKTKPELLDINKGIHRNEGYLESLLKDKTL